MKTYQGIRRVIQLPSGGEDVERDVTVNNCYLRERLDLYNHSPTGFEWGYGGSGPHQLALAILADCMGDEFALEHKHQFCIDFVSGFSAEWQVTEEQIRHWAKEKGYAN